MEEILRKELDATTELIPGSGGVFDIKVEGELVYSKFKTGRFPEPAEIVRMLK